MADHVLELTTEAIPPKKFTVQDGNGEVKEYELYGYQHLSPEDEAATTAAFSRFQQMFGRMERAKSDAHATNDAISLRKLRVKIITKLTDVPQPVVEGWNAAVQSKVLGAIQDEISEETGGDRDDEDGDDGGEDG